MFWTVAVSKAAAAINNINASKCSISTVSALLTAWVNGRALLVIQKQQVNKQTEQEQPLHSRNTDCSALAAKNKQTPPPAPGNTGAPHVACSPVTCSLLETSPEKNKLTQSRASLNPRALQELPWGITKLEHPQCSTHTLQRERWVLTCDEGVHDDVSGLSFHHRHLVHTFCGRWRSYDRFHVGIPFLILWRSSRGQYLSTWPGHL